MPYAALAELECENCGAEFVPHRPDGRYCSRECYVEHRRQTTPRGPKPIRNCVECGDPFKQMGPRQRRCRKPACHHKDHVERVLVPWREMQERIADRIEETKLKNRVLRMAAGKEPFGSEAWRLDQESAAAERLASELADSELASFVEEQEKERRKGDWVYQFVSFDDDRWHPDTSDQGEYGADKHAYLAGDDLRFPPVDDPLDILIQDEEREALAQAARGMEIEDVARLDGASLARLQDNLREADIGGIGVLRSERIRLRDPVAHTGEGVKKAPLIPGRKKRREKVAHKAANRARGNSNRPSQKPRKRWSRDESAIEALFYDSPERVSVEATQ